jgi:hypothetical protein
MTFSFRPAVRENVSLLVGLIGASGSGKTYTAMRLAKGIAGEKRFAVIDTEAGRAKHYADHFAFDHGDLKPPFTPSAYTEAIMAADAAGYPVIVVDSTSHEYAGDGGVLDMQERELERMAGDDWKKREACRMASWIKPKMEHKKMVQKLLQIRAHLILCFRAEEKIEMVKDKDNRWVIVPKKSAVGLDGWIPVTEKNLPYELTVSMLLLASEPGIPRPIKIQEQHRALFPLDKPITEDGGRLIAEWASGTHKPLRQRDQATPADNETRVGGEAPLTVTEEQIATIESMCTSNGINLDNVKKKAGIGALADLPAEHFDRTISYVKRVIAKREGRP